jgi:hypothetical protein
MLSGLRWWWRNVLYDTPYTFEQRVPRALLMTDMWDYGWGAVLWFADKYFPTYGSFSVGDVSPSFNGR